MKSLNFEILQLDEGSGTRLLIQLTNPKVIPAVLRPLGVSENDPELRGGGGGAAQLAQLGTDTTIAGSYLLNKVLDHPEIAAQLRAMLQNPDEQCNPIYVTMNAHGVEALPWEAMFASPQAFPGLSDGERFLSLSKWPVGRMIGMADAAPFPFNPPLRVVAILSALDVCAAGEWAAVRQALLQNPALPVEMLLVVGEPNLFTSIKNEAIPGLTVSTVPTDVDELRDAVTAFRPHIVHFFCHGSADGGGRLLVATALDWVNKNSDNTLVLQVDELEALAPPSMDPPWVLVLNCCESSTATPGRLSLAFDLVQGRRFPTVVAMREPVRDADANRFTKAFYQGLVTEVAGRIDGSLSGSWNWPQLMVASRREVAKTSGMALTDAAKSHTNWTLPTM